MSRYWPFIKLLPVKTNLRFVRYSAIIGGLSALACAASLFFTIWPAKPPCGGLNCGVDFRGGSVIELSTVNRQPADLGKIRQTLSGLGLGDIQVQAFGSASDVLVRFETGEGRNPTEVVEGAKTKLVEALGPLKFTRTEAVGPKVSGELFRNGVLALLLGIGMMMTYIWFRFGLTFGIGAAAALIHDVLLTFGLFAFTQMEFTLTAVASILTIIGYSVNDTVVILDRIRENLRKYKKMPLSEVIDLSINETLSRTAITGVTGIMALTGLAMFGGEALFGFSVSMIFGIVVGTYSSFFIAAPVLLLLGVKRGETEEEPKPAASGRAASRP